MASGMKQKEPHDGRPLKLHTVHCSSAQFGLEGPTAKRSRSRSRRNLPTPFTLVYILNANSSQGRRAAAPLHRLIIPAPSFHPVPKVLKGFPLAHPSFLIVLIFH